MTTDKDLQFLSSCENEDLKVLCDILTHDRLGNIRITEQLTSTDEWTDFEMDLVPCYNFYQQLLWHREKLEVLSPSSVREELHAIIRQILLNYDKK